MTDYGTSASPVVGEERWVAPHSTLPFAVFKHLFDITFALTSLPVVAGLGMIIWVLNTQFNPGPLFYTQARMGKHGRRFRMIKFRSMQPSDRDVRGHNAEVETSRVTRFGVILRRFRIDELPNMINVLRGEMSIVGPRPDAWNHAVEFCKAVPGYDERHAVRPGVTGLAQVEMGYAVGADATAMKVRYDRTYIRRYGFRQELRIVLKTLGVVATGFGAR